MGLGCESWRGGGIAIGTFSWVSLEGDGGRGEVMTVPKGENEEGVSGEIGMARGGAEEKVGSFIV